MRWIDENALKRWADQLDARALLVSMVADLIRATIADPTQFRFPGGNAGQVRGFDGDLETTDSVGLVPKNKSKWEFGTSPGIGKANSDYEKRTNATSPDVMRENTLVIVSLHKWDTPQKTLVDWVEDRNAEDKWAGVRYIDAVALVQWLENHPAVAARYAKKVLGTAPKVGALSTDEYWELFSSRFKPTLKEDVVLCDREEEAKQLLQQLMGPPMGVLLGAESSEEVVAFAVAAIRAAPEEQRAYLEARTLIVESEDAARFLSAKKNLVFITKGPADNFAGILAAKGPTLSGITGVQIRSGRHRSLLRPTANAMGEAFTSMGYERQEGYELAHRCGRSLTILRRLIPSGPAQPPEWHALASVLKPAFLAGGWMWSTRLDKELLTELAGTNDYPSFEGSLLPTLGFTDPPIDRVDDVWQVRAPVDAFQHYGHLISEHDLEKLRDAAIKVFSYAAPQPSRDERFSLTYNRSEDYSRWLRDGLALTLLLFAALPDVGGLHIHGKSPQQYVNDILNAIPGFGKKHETLLAVLDQVSALAEAAPIPFLSALESMLEGDSNEARALFVSGDDDQNFGTRSPHIHILWGLEVLAWDPKLVLRVALVLAKLAEIDPESESRSMNRPINSLRTIFLSWSPQTHATGKQRILAIDAVLKAVPGVAWEMLKKLMPRSHDSSSPTQKPKLRDTSPMLAEQLTYDVVWSSEAAIIERAIQLARGHEARVLHIVSQMAHFRPTSRVAALELIEQHLSQHPCSDGNPVWHALREEVSRHEYFGSSDWALAEDDLTAIKAVLDKYEPDDLLAKERQLFDDWHPRIGHREDEDSSEMIDSARVEALKRIWTAEGSSGILRFAGMVKLPQLLHEPMQKLDFDFEQAATMQIAAIEAGDPLADFAVRVSAVCRLRFGGQWEEAFKLRVAPACDSSETVARLLLAWPLERSTWSFVESLGVGIRDEYWRQINHLPLTSSEEELREAIDELRAIGRSTDVIHLLHKKIRKLSADLILALLDEAYAELVRGYRKPTNMLSYYLGDAFDALQGQVSQEEIARREYMYLPLLESERKPLSLHNFMATDPKFFVQVLSQVFGSKSGPRQEEVSEEERSRARTSYRLLSSFETIPGQSDAEIDYDELMSWISRVRKSAADCDRAEIADEYIGHLLAHGPEEPVQKYWPHTVICKAIEEVASDNIERGVEIERYNMRGVFRKAYAEGGAQERDLANTYIEWASLIPEYPRAAALLTRIAEGWNRDAKRADIDAEKRKLKN